MKVIIAIAIMSAISIFLSSNVVGDAKSPEAAQPVNPESLRPLLFADQPLVELVENHSSEAPWINFRRALEASQSGDAAAARQQLKDIAGSSETRLQLLAWNALRGLGVQPDAKQATVVRGVVAELHNEAGIGVVAAYADGRARFFGGTSGGVIWESPDTDAEISRLIVAVLAAAEPIIRTTRPLPHHNSTPVAMNYVRVTVLTFGGTYVADAFGPELTERSQVTPALMASTELMEALGKKRANAK